MHKLTPHEEWLCKEIVDAAYRVYNKLGPGLLEKVYETCFCYELFKKKIPYSRQVFVPINYEEQYFEEGLKLDVLVDNLIICELKAQENLNSVWAAQVISHIKLSDKHVGFLINFNVAKFKEGIRRFGVE